ncbi:MAG: hypothetical protein AABZ57_01800, partial [Candidatus Margulisiibacteriota bacterium]
MRTFQRRTEKYIVQAVETGRAGDLVIARIELGEPTVGKSTLSELDTRYWSQKRRLNYILTKAGFKPLNNKHIKMDWCLQEARKRAGVLGEDYRIQSLDYILDGASAIGIHTIRLAEANESKPLKINAEGSLAPHPLRNYLWKAMEELAREWKQTASPLKSRRLEMVGQTGDEELHEKALKKREENRAKIILAGGGAAPPEAMMWIHEMGRSVIDYLIELGKLPTVRKNYKDKWEWESFAFRQLYRYYCIEMLGRNAEARSLITINRFREDVNYVPDQEDFRAQYGLDVAAAATDLFGKTG